MLDVLCIGNVVQDIFVTLKGPIYLPDLPGTRALDPMLCLPYGAKNEVSEVRYAIGGSAANVATGLSLLGFRAAFVGAVGRDLVGHELRQRFEERGQSCRYLKVLPGLATSFSVIIRFRGERTTLTYHGLRDWSLVPIPSVRARLLFLGPLGEGFEAAYRTVLARVAERGDRLAINPGMVEIEERRRLLALLRVANVLIVNWQEACELARLSGIPRPHELLGKLQSFGAADVFITDGPRGAYAARGTVFLKMPALHVRLVDPTGAGDAFTSGVIAATLEGRSLAEALQLGTVLAASTISALGAQEGLPDRTQCERRLAKMAKPFTLEKDNRP